MNKLSDEQGLSRSDASNARSDASRDDTTSSGRRRDSGAFSLRVGESQKSAQGSGEYRLFDLLPGEAEREKRIRVYLRNHIDAERCWQSAELAALQSFPLISFDAEPVTAAEYAEAHALGGTSCRECERCGELISRLEEQYERICRAVEQTGDSVVITDDRGVIEYVNPAFEQTTGYRLSEVTGKKALRLLDSGSRDQTFYDALWGDLAAGKPFRGTIVEKKKNGELYPAEQTITPIRNAESAITHYVSVFKDISLLLRNKEQEFNLALAREVQQRFYRAAPEFDRFDLHGAAYPVSETGGDYFDFIPTPAGRLTVVVGDVSGHGFGAALVMSETRAYCRAFVAMNFLPLEVLTRINGCLHRDLDSGSFVTMAMLCLDPSSRDVIFSGAGHDPGIVIREDGEVQLLQSSGLPLGPFGDARVSAQDPVRMERDDVAVLITDGITEALSPEGDEFGLARAIDVIRSTKDRSAKEISDALLSAARNYMRGEAQTDDITVVVCKAL